LLLTSSIRPIIPDSEVEKTEQERADREIHAVSLTSADLDLAFSPNAFINNGCFFTLE
jgi:hypothetical protein